MKYSTSYSKPIFKLDLSIANRMRPTARIEYYDRLIEQLLNEHCEEKVTINYKGELYSLDGLYVPLFLDCQREREKAVEDLKEIEKITPTCTINWDKLKKLSLEEKMSYLEETIELIEEAPISDPHIYVDGKDTHLINKKDLSPLKLCQRELKKYRALYEAKMKALAWKTAVAETISTTKSAIDADIKAKKKATKKKMKKLAKKIKGPQRAGRIFRGTVKVADIKRNCALACALCFTASLTIESLKGCEVGVNKELLPSLPEASLKVKRSADQKVRYISYDFLTNSVITSIDKPVYTRYTAKSVQYDKLGPDTPISSDDVETVNIYDSRRQKLIDSYLEEYSLYFNLDKDAVISIAREATEDYANGFENIIGDESIDLTDEETACLVFAYKCYRDKLARPLSDFGYEKSTIRITDEVFASGRSEGEELILRNGETENQFITRVCKLLGLDEIYCLAISMYESGRFQSVMCRNKNNYGGLRQTKEFMTFPSPEAGIIAFCMNLKGYEKKNIQSIETLCSIYVYGSRSEKPSEVWLKNVIGFHHQISENYEEYTGYPKDEEEKTLTMELY